MKNLLGLFAGILLAGTFVAFGIARQVPTGSVKGVVVMSENGKPLANTAVTLVPIGAEEKDAEEEGRSGVWRTRTKKDGSFQMTGVPIGTYTVDAVAKEHSLNNMGIIVNEAQATQLDIRMTPNEPYLRLYASQKVFVPGETPKVEVHGFVPEDKLKVEVYKLDIDRTAAQGGVEETVQRLAYPSDSSKIKSAKDIADLTSTTDQTIVKKDIEGAFIEPLKLPTLPVGLYVVECRADRKVTRTFLNVSQIALVTKSVGPKSLCYVTDLKTGKPIPGAEILDRQAEKLNVIGKTGTDGLVDVTVTSKDHRAVVGARFGGSVALCGLYISESDPKKEQSALNSTIFVYTDRPVYRPGDEVNFKGIVRVLKGTEYILPPAGNAEIEIRDSDESLVEKFTAPVSKHGSYTGKFSTNKEAKPGVYTINTTYKGTKDTYSVNIAAYRKPDYNITIKPERESYYLGDKVRAVIECQYYYGAPVVGAKVSAYISRRSIWWDPSPDSIDSEEGDEEYYGGGGQYYKDVDAVTDANGRAVIEFDTKAEGDPDVFSTDYNYNINANVRDAGDKSTEGKGTIRVNRGAIGLITKLDSYIARKGQTVDVGVEVRSMEKGVTVPAGQSVELRIGTTTWDQNKSEFKETGRMTAVTGTDSIAHFKVPIKSENSVSLEAISRDKAGREVKAEDYIYVEGGPADGERSEGNLTLKLERQKFKVGDTIKAVIQTQALGGTALVTLEADSIIDRWLVPITSSSTVFNVPLNVKAAPNATVSVSYVQDKHFYSASSDVVVNRPDRKLAVTITPDRPEAKPGEKVTFKISTQTPDGKGTPAEVSLGVVDEGIYAVRKDTTNILKGLFPRRYNQVDTRYSFPEVYLDGGDKAGGSVKVRSNFKDTAQWNPTVETDSAGQASVEVTLPDNLTSWRATAVAASDDSAVGQTTAKIRVRKDLMVRLSVPQFLVEQDQQQVTMTVTNDTDKDADVNVSVETLGVALTENVPKTLRLGRGKSEVVDLKIAAPRSGEGSITAKAWISNGDSDGVKNTINVLPHGKLTTNQVTGQISGSQSFEVVVDPIADKTAGTLTVTVSPSLVSGMVQSLDSLIEFPYGCVEQTMSRFMPAILVSRSLKDSGLVPVELQKRVPLIAADGFARLTKMQHSDGGWGWWEYDDSTAFMTAWVLDGLHKAEAAGYPAPQTLQIAKAIKFAEGYLTGPAKKEALAERLYLMLALAEYGKADAVKPELARVNFTVANNSELALGALVYHQLGMTTEANTLMATLKTKAKITGDVASWDDQTNYWYGSESTGWCLQAYAAIDPQNPIVPKIVRYLMNDRGPSGWYSTRSTTIALTGLCAQLKANPISTNPATLRLNLNGKPLKLWTLDKSSLFNPDLKIEVPIDQLQPGANKIEFSRNGAGTSYFSAELKQFVREKNIVQVLSEDSISVLRNYYLIQAQPMEDGTLKLMPSKRPISEATSGDIIRCEIIIQSKSPQSYVLIEDPIPSNCRVTEREDPGEDGSWSWWWSQTVIRDDRVAFFARNLPEGKQVITYSLRAESPGLSKVLPTRLGNMYDPASTTYGGEGLLKVTR